MMLYGLPQWLMGVVVVGGCVGVVLVAHRLFRWLYPRDFAEQEVSGAMAMMGVAATITSLLLAFAAISVWESASAADAGVMNEASDCAMLARDLGTYGTPEALRTRAAVRDYVQMVIQEEWPLLARGESSGKAWAQLDTVFRLAHKIEVRTPHESVFLGVVWSRINDIVKHRRDRLHAAQSEVPGTLWIVVVGGSLLTFAFAFVLPRTRFSQALIAGLAATLGLVFHFIIAMQHPFAGEDGLTAEPLELTVRNLDRWDQEESRLLPPTDPK